MTASTLYEAVEPQALWRHLLSKVFEEIIGDGSDQEVRLLNYVAASKSDLNYSQGTQLARFTLREFHHDEEMRTVHFPLVSMAIIQALAVSIPCRFSVCALTLSFVASSQYRTTGSFES
jgi:hypothetical protein